MQRKFSRCLVGGTFDRFHSGHIHLIDIAVHAAENVEIWVADDSLTGEKFASILSLDDRLAEVADWSELTHGERISFHILRDVFGPAPTRADCDAIVCTVESRSNCDRINELRLDNGLAALEILEATHLEDALGGVISSTRIRAGLIDRQGNPWLENDTLDRKMPDELVASFKRPMGVLFEGPEESPELAMLRALEGMATTTIIVAVGDVCVQTLLELGIRPAVAVVDGMTKRSPLALEEQVSDVGWDQVLNCVNPTAMISSDLIAVCRRAVYSEGTVLIKVEGEEDLAPVPLHLMLPLDAVLVYGQPGEGVVLQISDELVKERCREMLAAFEVVSDE